MITKMSMLTAVLAVGVVLVAYTNVASASVTKVGVCHATGSIEHPYELITIADVAFPAHEAHGDFVAPENGDCSGGGGDPTPI